jgi:DNA-binding MarR family transcriptional regulator
MQPSELSEMQGISRNTASALIASLEKDGLIRRELDGTDHRKFLIHLTPEGRKLLKSHQKGHFEFITHCFEGFSASERETLLDLLTRLNKDLSGKV